MHVVIMKQLSKYQWEIVTKKGNIIKTDLSFKDAYQAEQYIISYITSFQNWSYEMEPLWSNK